MSSWIQTEQSAATTWRQQTGLETSDLPSYRRQTTQTVLVTSSTAMAVKKV